MLRFLMIFYSLCAAQSYALTPTPFYMSADAGYSVAPIMGTGFSLGAGIDTRNRFEFSYSQGEKDVNYAVMKAEVYSLKLKRFWSSSFYTNVGVAFKNVADRTTEMVSQMFTAERRANSFGIDLALGQKWSYDRLQFGVDYIGLFQPIDVQEKRAFVLNIPSPGLRGNSQDHAGRPHQRARGGVHSGNSRSGAEYDRHENDWNRLAHYATLQVLKAYIGWSF